MSSDSYAIIPPLHGPTSSSLESTSKTHWLVEGGPNVHDALRYGPKSEAADLLGQHALESRLNNWDDQQDKIKFKLQETAFGTHTTIRTMMDRQLVSDDPHFPTYSKDLASDIHLDILTGTDTSIDVHDVFGRDRVPDQFAELDIHAAMERKMGI